jgi:hypothetical protein
LDGTPQSYIQVNYLKNFTIGANYSDILSGEIIMDATLELSGASGKILTYNISTGLYQVQINSTELGGLDDDIGIFFITLKASKTNYSSQSISFSIEVLERSSELTLYLDGEEKSAQTSVNVTYGEEICISANFTDSQSGSFLDPATVELLGEGVSGLTLSIDANSGLYNISLDTRDLTAGVNFITLIAEANGYTTNTISFTIEVLERSTQLDITIDGQAKLYHTITYGLNFTLSANYSDYLDQIIIEGATLELSGEAVSGITLTYNDTLNLYVIEIDSSKFGVGITFITLAAKKENYIGKTVSITIEVTERSTSLELYLNDNLKTDKPSIDVIYGENFIISAEFIDSLSSLLIQGATLELTGEGVSGATLSLVSGKYQITIDSSKLGIGISFITLSASKTNYSSQTISITVEVLNRPTDIQIFLNGNETRDNTLELPIRDDLNITVKYYDNLTGQYIGDAFMQLIGEGLTLNLTEYQNFTQYSIIINTNQLDVGIRFLTISMEKENYEVHTPLIELQVRRIESQISLISHNETINTIPGATLQLNISLKDLDNNLMITNATLKYTVEFEQGEVKDLNNDGYYEINLEDLPEGTYKLVLTAYAGDDYEFKRYEITINVVRPPSENALFIALSIIGIGAAIGTGGYLIAYQQVLKYPKPIRKVHKYNKILKGKEKDVKIPSREEQISEIYNERLEKRKKLMEEKKLTTDTIKSDKEKLTDKADKSKMKGKANQETDLKKKSKDSETKNTGDNK